MEYFEMVRPEKWDFSVLPSLAGKTAIVTGANSPTGLGYNIAKQLFLKGAKVFIGARSLEKANSGIKSMLHAYPSLDASLLKPLVVDLADYKDLKRMAQKFVDEEDRLDILVNNAGIASSSNPLEVNAYGIEPGFGTNHVGTFLFTTTLLPLLVKTAQLPGTDVRIITVSSTAHYVVPPTAKFDSLAAFNATFDDPTDGSWSAGASFVRYGFSKLANVLFAKELQHRLDAQHVPILSMSLCPGAVGTDGAGRVLGRDSDMFKGAVSPNDGGITPVYAAAHPEPREQAEKYKGAFLMPWGGLKEPSALAKDEMLARQLWETTEKVLADLLDT